jgi:GR25 family glycosyltransferase involved in LPS biosynthesis
MNLEDSRIRIFIIETPNSNRSRPLFESFSDESRVEIQTIRASMLSTQSELEASGIAVDAEFFQAISNRKLSLPEIGCANSHNLSRYECSKLKLGGVIMEDDARILNKELFISSAKHFLEEFKDSSAILSFTYNPRIRKSRLLKIRGPFIRLFGESPLAVAYAITPIAAHRLYISNTPVKFVSDWPEIHVKHFCLLDPPVAHGDSETISTIDPSGAMGRTQRNFGAMLRKITLADYLLRARQYVDFRTYLKYCLLKPTRYYLDSIRFFLIRKFISK